MAKTEKKKTSYRKLLEKIHKFCWNLYRPERKRVLIYKVENLRGNYSLNGLYERVRTANHLGWTTELEVTNECLEVWHVKKTPIPMDWLHI